MRSFLQFLAAYTAAVILGLVSYGLQAVPSLEVAVELLGPVDPSAVNNAGSIAGQGTDDLMAAIVTTSGETIKPYRGDALGLSESGFVAATVSTETGQHCGRWSEQQGLVDLTPQATIADLCIAFAVNSRGDVVGAWRRGTLNGNELRAYKWTRTGVAIELGTLGGTESEARDVNDRGEVAGTSRTASGRIRGFRWTEADGIVALSLPAGADEADDAEVWAVNNHGDVAGVWHRTNVGPSFVIWESGDTARVVDLPAEYTAQEALDINELGWIAGTVNRSDGTAVPFVFADGTFIDLHAETGIGEAGRSLNDRGTIVGLGSLASGEQVGVRWTLRRAP